MTSTLAEPGCRDEPWWAVRKYDSNAYEGSDGAVIPSQFVVCMPDPGCK
jgi:hypothetical protein